MPFVNGKFTIPHNSPEHTKLIAAFQERYRLGKSANDLRSDKWQQNEEIMKAYVKASELDRLREAERKSGKPQYTTIEIPESYAALLTAHTYLASVFLSRTPIAQLTGRHGEAEMSVQAMESLLDYQITTGGAMAPLYVWLLDACKYGHGVMGHYWASESINSTQTVMEAETLFGIPIPGTEKPKLKQISMPGYKGARHYNVRPQDWMFDPRVPIRRFQEGEFVIRFDQISWNTAVTKKNQGQYFNLDRVEQLAEGTGDRDRGSPQSLLPGEGIERVRMTYGDGKHPSTLDIHEWYFDFIPSEFGVSQGKNPERWVFTVWNKQVIIGAAPLGLAHNQYPFDVLEYEINGHELFGRSILEISKPLNDVMTWLFNSHFFNVRKALNDQFVVDPSKIVVGDLENPNPGKLVRLKPAAYGSDVRSILAQLPVSDVTRSHIPDAEAVRLLHQRILGVTDNLMGMVNASGRKTATEVRTSSSFAANRLKTTAEWMSSCGWAPWIQKLTQMTQQMYDIERMYRIVGDAALTGSKYMKVAPEDIVGFYDFVPVDGTMPIDRFAQANLWQQIMAGVNQMPQVSMQYDMGRIFAYVAQLAGLKNISQFRVQVIPNAVAAQGAQSGNLVNIAPGNPAEPGQIATVGPTG